MASEAHFEPQLRLHPLSWLFVLLTQLRQMIVPLLVFLLFGMRNDADLWGALVIVPFVLAAVWRQWIYRYGFAPQGLVIHEGLLFRNVRRIEYQRIENIDVERGLLHRLFGVAEVRIATSTGGKPEAFIRVLDLDAVQALRERIFDRASPQIAPQDAPPQTEPPEAGEILLNLPPAELVRYGLIDNRGLLVVAAIAGLIFQAGAPNFPEMIAASIDESSLTGFVALGIFMQAALLIGSIAAIVVALRVLSVGMALVTLHDFTLTRYAEDLRIRYGLFTRVALTLRVRRIQSVHQTETLLHRWFGRMSLRVDLAGDSGGAEQQRQQSRSRVRWLAPICTPAQARTLIAAALPDADLAVEPEWQPLAPGARKRLFRRSVYVIVLLCALAAVLLHLIPAAPFKPQIDWLLLAPLLIVPLAWLRAHIYVKNTRWALTRDAILFRDGWLTRRLIVAPRNRLQSVKLSSSPFDRRYQMASVSLDTAGGGAMHDNILIPLLPVDVARQLATTLYHSRVTAGAAHQPTRAT